MKQGFIQIQERFYIMQKTNKVDIKWIINDKETSSLFLNTTGKEVKGIVNQINMKVEPISISLSMVIKTMQLVIAWLALSDENIVIFYGMGELQAFFCSISIRFCEMTFTAAQELKKTWGLLFRRDGQKFLSHTNPVLVRYAEYIDILHDKKGRVENKPFLVQTVSIFGSEVCKILEIESEAGKNKIFHIKCLVERMVGERFESVFDLNEKVYGETLISIFTQNETPIYRFNTAFCQEGVLRLSSDKLLSNTHGFSARLVLKRAHTAGLVPIKYERIFSPEKKLEAAFETLNAELPRMQGIGKTFCLKKCEEEGVANKKIEKKEVLPKTPPPSPKERHKEEPSEKKLPSKITLTEKPVLINRPLAKKPPPPPPIKRARNKIWFKEELKVDEIDAKVLGGVWAELDGKKKTEFDLDEFERKFCISEGKTKMPEKEKRSSYELQKLNNISIGLSRFKSRFKNLEELFDAIRKHDERIGEDDLAVLLEITKKRPVINEEEEQKGDIYSNPLLFISEVMKKETFFEFCELYYLKTQFFVQEKKLSREFDFIIDGLAETINSEELKGALKGVLDFLRICKCKYGRFKQERDFCGFDIKNLLMIRSVRTVDKSETLLEYISKHLPLELKGLLEKVKPLVSIALEDSGEAIKRLHHSLNRMSQWLEGAGALGEPNEKIAAFVIEGEGLLTVVEKKRERMEQLWKEAKEYFFIREGQGPCELFSILHEFLDDWDKTKRAQCGSRGAFSE
eukprot:GHVN01000067.1.p1 GENE.GHVN01000067.1~~GHVN01000067.1.p1  ORF type:complete len:741 (-),score=105.41 GHVN01000067.1:5895-8117(-)